MLSSARAFVGRHPGRARRLTLWVAAIGLWTFAAVHFSQPPPPKSGQPNRAGTFRIDVNDIEAYPRSDAAMDYLNGMAILSGDGWVNWRDTNRWSIYRPGWGAILAGLELLTGGEPRILQAILTLLLAAAAPVFMLLILHLFPGGRDLLLAIVATLVFIVSPFAGWWFQRTMMSEGPTLLLALLFCLLAIRYGRRAAEWSWRQGLVLGLVGGAISLVREQSRFGVLAVLTLLALASLGRWRRRLPFFAAAACGLLAVVAPLYLKTSLHLRMPYAGTSYVALYSVLDYTEIGRRVGGGRLPADVALSEREATRLLQERVFRGLRLGLSQPLALAQSGFLQYSRFIHGAAGAAAKRRLLARPESEAFHLKLTVFYLLTAVGLYYAWRRAGPVALAPLVFAAGYLLPMMPFWFYRARFGVPVSWVGLAYIAGAVLLFAAGRARDESHEVVPPAAGDGGTSGIWPPRRFFYGVAAWIGAATALLLWLDHRALPGVDVERLFADDRSRETLVRAGVSAGADLIDEADRLLNRNVHSERLLVGVAAFPMTVRPGDEPVPLPFGQGTLDPREESFDVVYLVSPWKRAGGFRVSQVGLPAGATAPIRPGDEVLVVRRADAPDVRGESGVVGVEAAVGLPTRWAD